MGPLIKLEHVCRSYPLGATRVAALRGVSLQIAPGEFVAILGPSGSGKSTLMNLIGCLDRPTEGRYLLEGVDVAKLDHDALADIRNQKIGFVFQNFNLLPRTSALRNVEMPMLYAPRPVRGRTRRRLAAEALALVGLAGRADHHANQLSGGEQQRVAIARSIVNSPSLLLADEPTGNLDSRTSAEIMTVFHSLNQRGITIVMVTHEPDVARHAQRNVFMRDGLILTDTPVTDRLDTRAELRPWQPAEPAEPALTSSP
jgi:putative ABC transport system ATP-binding protein